MVRNVGRVQYQKIYGQYVWLIAAETVQLTHIHFLLACFVANMNVNRAAYIKSHTQNVRAHTPILTDDPYYT